MKAEIPAAQDLAALIIKEHFGGAAEVQMSLQIQNHLIRLLPPPAFSCLADASRAVVHLGR